MEETLLIPLEQSASCTSAAGSPPTCTSTRTPSRAVTRSSSARPTAPALLDDRSSNGTFVNGRRISQAELRDGDVILLGRVVLRYLEV